MEYLMWDSSTPLNCTHDLNRAMAQIEFNKLREQSGWQIQTLSTNWELRSLYRHRETWFTLMTMTSTTYKYKYYLYNLSQQERLQEMKQHSQTQGWKSPERMKKNIHSSQYRFEEKQIKGLNPEEQHELNKLSFYFFTTLECDLAEKYLGVRRYWRLIYVTQGFGELSFRVEAVDGGEAQVIIAKQVVKFMGISGPMGHVFQKQNRQSQECQKCNQKIHEFLLQMKNKFKIPMEWNLRQSPDCYK